MCNSGEFTIQDGILTAYKGNETCVVIPAGVTEIQNGQWLGVFESNLKLEEVIFPDHPIKVQNGTFYGCSNLKKITMPASGLKGAEKMFGGTGKTIELRLLRNGMEPLRTVGAFRKDYWSQVWNYPHEYLVPLTAEDLPNYDRLVAAGEFEGFKMNEQGRLLAMLLRLQEENRPVAPEYREMFGTFLASKLTKAIKLAEEEQNPAHIQALLDVGAITEDNKKKAKNALKKSKVPGIAKMAEELDDRLAATAMAELREEPAEHVEQKYLDLLKKLNASAVLLKAGLSPVPSIPLQGSAQSAPAAYIKLVLAAYLSQAKQRSYEFVPLADEAAAQLDQKALAETVRTLYDQATPESVQQMFLPVVFRYGDGATVGKLYRDMKAKKWMQATASQLLLLSDTREAMLLADQNKLLDLYADLRGVDAMDLRDTKLYDFGFDANGKRAYNLGVTTIEVSLNQDLTLSLYDTAKGKTVKSIPKKNVDPDVYAAASGDFSDMRKTIKKAAKTRNLRLFQSFLEGETFPAQTWLAVYPTNPLLRQLANLLVWAQGDQTFILRGAMAVDVTGQDYTFSDAPICLAHPMEMQPDEVEAWQKYFTTRGLKQPFEQVWEPVIDPKSIRADRYKDCLIPYYRFLKQEKHGITVHDYDYHNCIDIYFEDCTATVERIDWRRHDIDIHDNFEVSSFGFRTFTRQVNHIAAYLDRVSVYGRILKDDVGIEGMLSQFTLAQITDFIRLASENQCTNVTALLLAYQHRTFGEFDPLDAFALDL